MQHEPVSFSATLRDYLPFSVAVPVDVCQISTESLPLPAGDLFQVFGNNISVCKVTRTEDFHFKGTSWHNLWT